MKFFISHIHEEAPAAEALRAVIERTIPGSDGWVSSTDITAGQQWLNELDEVVQDADLVIVLASQHSVERSWINFEAGAGWARNVEVVPVCHQGMSRAQLPLPLSALQSFDLYTLDDLDGLVRALSPEARPPGADDWREVEIAEAHVDYVPPALRPIRAPRSSHALLIDMAHGQASWSRGHRGNVFDVTELSPQPDLPGDLDVASIERRDQIRSDDLEPWRGLIVVMPWRDRLSEPTIDEIVNWVRRGGRLVMMGFELGDLHHSGNLNALATRFGLRFQSDIIAPHQWGDGGKPYGVDVEFDTVGGAANHPVLDDVETLTWTNVQSVARELGTQPLATVGDNVLTTPDPESAGFADGHLTMPNPTFEVIAEASWLPVMAAASRHLVGNGGVLATGTWQIGGAAGPNRRFFVNLLRWLAGDDSPGLPSGSSTARH